MCVMGVVCLGYLLIFCSSMCELCESVSECGFCVVVLVLCVLNRVMC